MADMSGVVEQINRISTNILDSFVAVEEKGGTLPSVLNSDNLPDAIESISGGGVPYQGQYHFVPRVIAVLSGGSGTVTGAGFVDIGETVTLSFTSPDYYVTSWVKGGTTIGTGQSVSYVQSDTTDQTITVNVAAKTLVPIPYIDGSYTYSGSPQTISVQNYDSSLMTETGDSRTQTNHRDTPYKLTWTLKDTVRNMWVGGGSDPIEGEWTMQKASMPPTISGSLSWGTGTGNKEITISNPALTQLTIESTNNTQFRMIEIKDSVESDLPNPYVLPAGTPSYKLTVKHESATGATGTINVVSAGDNNHLQTTASVECSSSTPSCVPSDTMITLSDRSRKRIDELTYEDELLTYNLNTGEYEGKAISKIYFDGEEEFNCLNLTFDNDTVVKMMTTHGFLNCTKREYSQITLYNYEDYIGDEFLTEDGRATLVSAEIIPEETGAWSLITKNNENFITEGIVSMTGDRGAVFAIAEDMKYDAEAKANDIETYGLFEYEEFKDMMSEEDFYDLNCPDYKVLVGKGIIDMDYIYYYIPLLVEDFVV